MSKRTKNIDRVPIRNIIRHRRCVKGDIDYGSICSVCVRKAWNKTHNDVIRSMINMVSSKTGMQSSELARTMPKFTSSLAQGIENIQKREHKDD